MSLFLSFPPDSCFSAQDGQRQITNIVKGNDPDTIAGLQRFFYLHFSRDPFALNKDFLLSFHFRFSASLYCRIHVLHKTERQGLFRKHTENHERGALVFTEDDPREPCALHPREETAAGTVLQRPSGDICSVLWK